MYILITGGAGYIGSHIAKLLAKQTNNIIIFDNLCVGNIENCKYGIFIKGDITNISDLDSVFSKYKISHIIHVAGKAFVSESFQKIDEYYNTNVIGTINILNMMVKYNVSKIIFSSSCAVYGNVEKLPITENTEKKPISPYGLTKKIAEDIILDYAKIKNIKYVILRYFNVAGNDFDLDVKDIENNTKRLIPNIIKKIINSEILYINGNNYNTKDGTCIRNYIHVLDLAEAHINSLNYNENLICNLGSNNNYSILEIIELIEKYINKKCLYKFNNRIEGDPEIVYCNNDIAKEKLNWIIKYNIEDIIKSTILLSI